MYFGRMVMSRRQALPTVAQQALADTGDEQITIFQGRLGRGVIRLFLDDVGRNQEDNFFLTRVINGASEEMPQQRDVAQQGDLAVTQGGFIPEQAPDDNGMSVFDQDVGGNFGGFF